MVKNRSFSDRKKEQYTRYFLLMQLFLCSIIIVVIVFIGNRIYFDNVSKEKQMMLDAGKVKMEENVHNTIVRIDLRRDVMKEQISALIELCIDRMNNGGDKLLKQAKEIGAVLDRKSAGRVIQIVIEDGSTYTWFNSENTDGKKISRTKSKALLGMEAVRKQIKQQGYIVSCFALQREIDELVKEEVYDEIHAMEYTGDSYVWVNEIMNMEGGENYAIRRIHPNLVDTEGEYLSTSMQDVEGNYPYEVELNGIREKGKIVQQYYFKNKSNNNIEKKISYAELYKPFNWIVATGIPINSIYAGMNTSAEERTKTLIFEIAAGCLVVIMLLYLSVKKVMRELSKAKKMAENANSAKTTFLFNMSHDIRTPINAIMGFTKLLEKYQEEPGKRADYLKKIEDSSSVLLSIINNVLEMARIEKGKLELDETAWSTEQFNDTLYSIFYEMMTEKGISFIRQIDVKHHYVFCAPYMLREVFINILSNAYKYTNPGGEVSMHLKEIPSDREGYALYQTTIRDTGIGMSEEFIPHIYEEFARENNTTDAKVEGTGLGMPIVRRLVDFMEGTIEVKSKKDEGTTFIVTIPHRIADKSDLMQHANVELDPKLFKDKRILLAEDNELNAEIAIEILEEAGFKVELAEDGQICLDMLNQARAGYYDLILMDIQMPNLNGYEATREIRILEDSEKANIPILAMTANAFEEDKREAKKAGMNGHLGKPVEVGELMKELARVLA